MSKLETITIFVIAVMLIGVYFALPPIGIYTEDGGAKYIQMKSFCMNQWKSIEIPYPAKAIDPDIRWMGRQKNFIVRDGKLFCSYQPAFTFLSSLFFPFLGTRVIYFLPLVTFFLSIIFLLKTLQIVMPKNRLFFLLLFAYTLASPVMIYSITFWEHMPAVFLVTVGLYYMVRSYYQQNTSANLFLSSFFVSLGIFFREGIFLFWLAFFTCITVDLYINKQRKNILYLLLGGIIPIAGYLLSNFILYRNFLGLHLFFSNQGGCIPLRKIAVIFTFFSISSIENGLETYS